MKMLFAKDYGILPGEEIAEKLSCLSENLRNSSDNTVVLFEKGEYYIDSLKCKSYEMFITNTAADDEFSSDEKPHLSAVGIYIKGVKNLVLDGDGSVFLIDGKATNITVSDCENITLKNFSINHIHPDMHEMKVVNIADKFADFKVDNKTLCKEIDGEFYFVGNGYRHAFMKYSRSGWIGLVKNEDLSHIKRAHHPLRDAEKIEKIGENLFRVYYDNTDRFTLFDRFYIYEVRRDHVGIFVEGSKNIVLDNIKQHFNYSLAVVAQDSENLTVKNSVFEPEDSDERLMCSGADFLQICMCRGDFVCTDNIFCGAGDDCMNVHGVHFEISQISGNKLTVDFRHPQTHGFNPLRKGDKIAFIDSETMLEVGCAEIVSSYLINENQIELEVTSTSGAKIGFSIEDVSACPNVYFAGNRIDRIITRGILVTNRNKTLIENNDFVSCDMSGVLLSDDANSWYESGMCCDMTIKNNIFRFCGDAPVRIFPENKIHAGAVHKNISIIGNDFLSYDRECIVAKSTDNILIESNKFSNDCFLKVENCTNVKINQ